MSTQTIELQINGMTCGHCVASVTEELGEVAGVTGVDVDLNAGGTSRATVTTSGEVDAAALQSAVTEAGYTLVDSAA